MTISRNQTIQPKSIETTEANVALINNRQLVHIQEQWAVEECIKRDMLHSSMNGFGISIGKESVNDASMCLLHHFINYKTQFDCASSDLDASAVNLGLVEWLRVETFEALTNGDLISHDQKNKIVKIKHRSLYWVVGGVEKLDFTSKSGSLYTKATLLGIKSREKDDVDLTNLDPKKYGVIISIHTLNRLSSRVLNIFIEKGLMLGMNLCEFLSEGMKKPQSIAIIGEHKFKLRYDDLNLITTAHHGQERKLITVLA